MRLFKKNNHAKLYNDCSAKRPKSKCKDAGQTVWRHDTIRLHKQSRISDVQSAFAVGHKLTTMAYLISEKIVIARKEHHDDCSEWILNTDLSGELTFAERRAIVLADRAKWKILPGQKYLRQTCKEDGRIHTFKGRPELIAICQRFGLFDGE